MTRMNHEHRNRMSKVQGPNPVVKKKKNRVKPPSDWIKMTSKYENKCLVCTQKINMGTGIFWSKSTKKTIHAGCMSNMLKNGINPKRVDGKMREKMKLDKKGKSPFIAPAHTRGWRDIA